LRKRSSAYVQSVKVAPSPDQLDRKKSASCILTTRSVAGGLEGAKRYKGAAKV